MNREWREVPGYPGYLVSDAGDVVSTGRYVYSKRAGHAVLHHRRKTLSQNKNKSGYLYVSIGAKETGGNKKEKVHRLVAMAFVPNPDGLPQVNHKDGVKTNNQASNLEWVTTSENVKHAWRSGLQPKSDVRNKLFMQNRRDNGVNVVVVSGNGERHTFPTMQACADFIGIDRSCVSRACKNGTRVRGLSVIREK